MAILELINVEKHFGETKVLNSINLSVNEGEFITLLGPSGCGKTTTLRIISGLEEPDGGKVILEGTDVTDTVPNKRNVNTVFQNYALFPHMNVESNVGYSLKIRKMPKTEIKKRVSRALEMVQLEGFAKRMPGELSGGQRQRVAIARSIVNVPKVLLLDEPLGALDLQLRRQMQIELKRLQKTLGMTFIYITHDQEEALNMSDRIAVMRNGVFEQIGTPSDVYDRPRTAFVAEFVGSANIIEGTAKAEKGFVRVERSDGCCTVPLRDFQIADGDSAMVAVRSEQIELMEINSEKMGISGTIKEKSFAGGMLRISIVPDGQQDKEIIASRHGLDSKLAVGERVKIGFAPESGVLVRN